MFIRTARTLTKTALFACVSVIALSIVLPASSASYTLEQPEYAQWGRLAIQETQKRYPQAAIVDYLHVGRVNLASSTAEETFKLWLRQNGREWGVFVHIQFVTRTSQVLSIRWEKVSDT